MNKAQETHVKSIAEHIEHHAQAIVTAMAALQRNSLANMPVDLTQSHFSDVTTRCQEMRQVLADMLPHMPVDEIRQGYEEFQGYGEDGPRFSHEDGVTTDNYPWQDHI